MTWSAPARRAFRYDPLMFVRLRYLLGWVISVFRSREELLLENLALRQQLLALCSASREPGLRLGGRVGIEPSDIPCFQWLLDRAVGIWGRAVVKFVTGDSSIYNSVQQAPKCKWLILGRIACIPER